MSTVSVIGPDGPVEMSLSALGPLPGALELPPAPITRRQLRLWLVRNGIPLASIEAAIAALPEAERVEAEIEWADASAYEFANPLVAAIGSAIGMTTDQMKQGFREAALI